MIIKLPESFLHSRAVLLFVLFLMPQKCIYHIVDAITALFVEIALADIAFLCMGFG